MKPWAAATVLLLAATIAKAGLDVPGGGGITQSQLDAAAASNLLAMQQANAAAGYITQQQAIAAAPVQSVNGKTGVITTATLPGFFTVSSATTPLPDPTLNTGRYANVSDLAGVTANGGAGNGLVYSNGVCWSRFRAVNSTPQPVTVATTVNLVALSSSSSIQLSASAFATAAAVKLTGYCQGDPVDVMFPAGLISATGSLGISINNSVPLPVPALAGALNGTWAEFRLNGTTVVKTAGGTL